MQHITRTSTMPLTSPAQHMALLGTCLTLSQAQPSPGWTQDTIARCTSSPWRAWAIACAL